MATNTFMRIAVLAAAIAGGALAGTKAIPSGGVAAATNYSNQTAYTYGWPIKPFDRQHPVRGNFGDPRMVFAGRASRQTVLEGDGDFSFHRGIDIAARDNEAVYPVASGDVTRVTTEEIDIDSGNGRVFEYWHLVARVHGGEHVEARTTVLGNVLPSYQHVHLSELDNGRLVNPLAPGHLGPYRDQTRPTVLAITARRSDRSADIMPLCLDGTVELVANAFDTPSIPVPGMWHGLPVSPAKISFRIARADTNRLVIGETTAVDFREGLPSTDTGRLWLSYARGTLQNMTQFGNHRFWFAQGVYLFKLTPSGLDTTRLQDGAYAVTVTARDTAGNSGTATQVFTIDNHGSRACA